MAERKGTGCWPGRPRSEAQKCPNCGRKDFESYWTTPKLKFFKKHEHCDLFSTPHESEVMVWDRTGKEPDGYYSECVIAAKCNHCGASASFTCIHTANPEKLTCTWVRGR